MEQTTYFYLVSYARKDTTPELTTFLDDLKNEVTCQLADDQNVEFRCAENIDLGTDWRERITEAVNTCHVFVPILTPKLFNSDHCGQEWSAFLYRARTLRAHNKPLIRPVLWVPNHPSRQLLPDVVSKLQYTHRQFGEVYSERGLRWLKVGALEDDYRRFLLHYAAELVETASDHPLEPLANPPSFDAFPSAFSGTYEELTRELDRVGARSSGARSSEVGAERSPPASEATRPAHEAVASPSGSAAPTIHLEDWTAGETYEVALLSLDLVEHSAILETLDDNAGRRLLDNYLEWVKTCLHPFHATLFSWSPGGGSSHGGASGGGLFAFRGPDMTLRCVLAGLELLNRLDTFNLDPYKNVAQQPIELRVAAHTGSLVFENPTSQIHADCWDEVTKFQEEWTQANSLSVSGRVLKTLPEPLKSRFSYKHRDAGEALYETTGQRARDLTQRTPPIDALVSYVRTAIKSILDLLASGALERSATDLKPMSSAIDSIYTAIQNFADQFETLDSRWSKEYSQSVLESCVQIRSEEDRLFRTVQESYRTLGDKVQQKDLFAILNVAGGMRARLVPTILDIERRLTTPGEGGEAGGRRDSAARPLRVERDSPTEVSERFKRALRDFAKSDQLAEEAVFVGLIGEHLIELILFLKGELPIDVPVDQVLPRLWRVADLLLLEDLGRKSTKRERSTRLFPVLCQDANVGSHFELVRQLLQDDSPPTPSHIRKKAKGELELMEDDIIIVWRCLLLCHPSERVRQLVAQLAPLSELWQTVAYAGVPIASLLAVTKCFGDNEDEVKVFFDCTRLRLQRFLDQVEEKGDLERALEIVFWFFNFQAFAERGYFERADDLLRRALDKAPRLGVSTAYYSGILERIDKELRDRSTVETTLPRGIRSLPLAIQRHLAAEPLYLQEFALHPDSRIALETVRNIGPANVESLLRLRSINGAVFDWILKRGEYFRSRSTIYLVMSHPKCTAEFASRYGRQLSQMELKRISVDHNASGQVRAMVRRWVEQKGRGAAARRRS